MVKLVRTN